jgi:hypothetical protein
MDQYNADFLLFDSTVNGGSADYEWQQGVTAGVAGQLTRLAVYVATSELYGETADTEVSLWLGPPWQTDAAVWSTTAKGLKSGWATFNLNDAKIFVEQGDEYSIGIRGQSESDFNPGIGISWGDAYPGGDLFLNGGSAEGVDLLFRTYVSPKRTPRDE